MAKVTWNPGINSLNPTVELEVTQKSQSVSGNYSTIEYTLTLKRPSEIISSASKSYRVIINGSTVKSGTVRIGGSGNLTVAKGSVRVNHNSNGEKKNMTFSFNMDIGILWSGIQTGNASGSGTMNLTTIPRASSISSFPNFNIGSKFTVKINRATSAFTHTLELLAGSKIIGTWNNVGASIEINLTTSQQNEIYKTIPNSTSRQMTLKCRTYNNSTAIGSVASKTATANVPTNIVPTISSIEIGDFGNYTKVKYVQGMANITIEAKGVNGVKYSTIENYQFIFGGESRNSFGNIITTGVINKSGAYKIEVIVTDSRGRTAKKTTSVNIVPYSNPKINSMTVERTNSSGNQEPLGTYLRVRANGTFTSLSNKNSVNIVVATRAMGDEIWSYVYEEFVSSGSTFSIDKVLSSYPVSKSYEVNLIVTDDISRSNAYRLLPSGEVVMSWGQDGVGIGKVHERGALDLGGPFIIQNSDGTRTVMKPSGDVAMGFGVPGANPAGATNDANLQIWHHGGMRIHGTWINYPPNINIYHDSSSALWIEYGYLTGGSKDIPFNIILPAIIHPLSSVSITRLSCSIRTVNGLYIGSGSYVAGGYDFIADPNFVVEVYGILKNRVCIRIRSNTTLGGGQINNTPLTVEINKLTINLSS